MTDSSPSEEIKALLRCPACGSVLSFGDDRIGCTSAECGAWYPIVDAVPVLINERNSVFAIADFVEGKDTFFTKQSKLTRRLNKLTPSISANLRARNNYSDFVSLLKRGGGAPRVLILGGSIVGVGVEQLLECPDLRVVETDVAFGQRTQIICDAHDIPFADESVDGVVAQAVLEHVADPQRCVEEVHRVLKADGIVYSEIPFMQPVHGRQYDFTRFTLLGHRRLFRKFEQISGGAQGGPGMALALSWQYFLLSFGRRRSARKLLKLCARYTSWFLKYFDHLLLRGDAALDAASGTYFLGRKCNEVLSDKDLVEQYRGGF